MTHCLNIVWEGTWKIFTKWNISLHSYQWEARTFLLKSTQFYNLLAMLTCYYSGFGKHNVNTERRRNQRAAVTGLNLTFQHLRQASSNQDFLQDSPEYCKPVLPFSSLQPSLNYFLHSAPLLGLKQKRHTVTTELWHNEQKSIYWLL